MTIGRFDPCFFPNSEWKDYNNFNSSCFSGYFNQEAPQWLPDISTFQFATLENGITYYFTKSTAPSTTPIYYLIQVVPGREEKAVLRVSFAHLTKELQQDFLCLYEKLLEAEDTAVESEMLDIWLKMSGSNIDNIVLTSTVASAESMASIGTPAFDSHLQQNKKTTVEGFVQQMLDKAQGIHKTVYSLIERTRLINKEHSFACDRNSKIQEKIKAVLNLGFQLIESIENLKKRSGQIPQILARAKQEVEKCEKERVEFDHKRLALLENMSRSQQEEIRNLKEVSPGRANPQQAANKTSLDTGWAANVTISSAKEDLLVTKRISEEWNSAIESEVEAMIRSAEEDLLVTKRISDEGNSAIKDDVEAAIRAAQEDLRAVQQSADVGSKAIQDNVEAAIRAEQNAGLSESILITDAPEEENPPLSPATSRAREEEKSTMGSVFKNIQNVARHLFKALMSLMMLR